MGVGQNHIGYRLGRQTQFSQLVNQGRAYSKGSDVNKRDMTMASQQRNRAPTQTAMAYRLTGIALNQEVNLVATCVSPYATERVAIQGFGPQGADNISWFD